MTLTNPIKSFVINNVAYDVAYKPWVIQTANYVAQVGDRIVANGASAGFTVTLPTDATEGDEVQVLALGTNTITINPVGANLNGAIAPLSISSDRQETHFIYLGSTGWVSAIGGGTSSSTPTPTTSENNSIVQKLTAYYAMEEESGVRNSSKGTYPLTVSGTVARASGKLGNCAVFSAPSNLKSGDAIFSPDLSSFCFFGWFKLDSKANYSGILSKWDANGTAQSDAYIVYHNRDSNKLDVFIRTASGEGVGFSVDAPDAGVWTFFYLSVEVIPIENNKFTGVLSFKLNNGTATTISFNGLVASNSTPFALGAYNTTAGQALTALTGAMDSIGYCKGSLLTTAEQTYLWNSGNGKELIF